MRNWRSGNCAAYVAELERGARRWKGKAAEQVAVYANRRRIFGARGKRLQGAGRKKWSGILRISSIPERWSVRM